MSLSERYHILRKCPECGRDNYISMKEIGNGNKIHCDCGHDFDVPVDEEQIKAAIEKLDSAERKGNELGIVKMRVERKPKCDK